MKKNMTNQKAAPAIMGHAHWASVDTPEFHAAFDSEIAKRQVYASRSWGMIIDGKRRAGVRKRRHVSCGDSDVLLGEVAVGSPNDVEAAVGSAHDAFPAWRNTSVEARIDLLRRFVQEMESHQFDLAALISFEIGKNRFEAMTEVHEAIQLVRFYCKSMEEQHELVTEYAPLGNERSVSVMRPFGVWAILSPFNFPFALGVGMASAALLTGNTVVFKPPSLGPASGSRFIELCHQAGIPNGVAHLVLGDSEFGRALISHPLIAGVGFVGSSEVGTFIRRTLDGRPVVAEMGGKNPAIVMRKADLEMAAEAICRSAFRFNGQKCSACSRVYVYNDMADALADEVFARAKKMKVGIPWQAGTTVGPLIDKKAKARFDEALQAARSVARRTLVTTLPEGLPKSGAYTEFAIAVDLPEDHDIIHRELFCPLLCIQSVKNIDDAIARANDVPYGLTAGLFSKDEKEINQFLDEIEAGVVYVNRATGATTGAWVGHQSFGGWKGSGSTNVNAHGAYYLHQFAREQSRTVVGK